MCLSAPEGNADNADESSCSRSRVKLMDRIGTDSTFAVAL